MCRTQPDAMQGAVTGSPSAERPGGASSHLWALLCGLSPLRKQSCVIFIIRESTIKTVRALGGVNSARQEGGRRGDCVGRELAHALGRRQASCPAPRPPLRPQPTHPPSASSMPAPRRRRPPCSDPEPQDAQGDTPGAEEWRRTGHRPPPRPLLGARGRVGSESQRALLEPDKQAGGESAKERDPGLCPVRRDGARRAASPSWRGQGLSTSPPASTGPGQHGPLAAGAAVHVKRRHCQERRPCLPRR